MRWRRGVNPVVNARRSDRWGRRGATYRALWLGLALAAIPAPAPAAQPAPRMIVVALDVTGSFQHFDAAVRYLGGIAAQLGPGDEINVMTIGADSFADNQVVLQARMPRPRRALDPGFRRRLQVSRQALLEQLGRIRLAKKAMRTDLIGSLHAAARLLASAPSESERWLVFLSDMIDDVNRPAKRPIDLGGARVRCLFVQRGAGPHAVDELYRRMARWRELFTRSGAADAALCDPAQSMRFANPFEAVHCDG
jgi:hypothetical protein